ncbi:MAG TPA: hypothetical protein VHD60_03450, partial [Candidatus Saccharimonadales bacterium]|nr:hypothetical protein [Candidatus Saccharimonadales bacterium]
MGSAKTTVQARKRPQAKSAVPRPRRLKPPTYKTFRYSKRIKHPVKLPNVFKITKQAIGLLWQNKRFFIILVLIYGVLNILFVRGLTGGTDVTSLKDTLNQIFTGHVGHFVSGLTVFALLVSSSGNTSSATAGAYQTMLILIVSLAVVWSLRQFMAGSRIRVRDSFYQGMYPLVPVLLVLAVIGLQLVPALIGSTLYSIVASNGIAVYAVEKVAWALLYGSLALLSLYMVTSSVFALYIAALPDMTPMKALRSARELVRYRRWTVMRKVLFLPLFLLVVAAIIMVPIIIFLTPAAEWVFFLLTMI